MSEQDEIYGLEPESEPKRVPAPPTRPDTLPGATGDTLIDESMRRKRSSRAVRDYSDDSVVMRSYLTPIVMFIAGTSIVSLLLVAQGAWAAVPFYFMKFAITVPIGLGVFLLCCLLWIGFDAPIHLIALQLAGIYAVTDVAWAVIGFIPLSSCLLWIVPAGIYVGLLASLLEIEVSEAILVGVLTFIVTYVPAALLVLALS